MLEKWVEQLESSDSEERRSAAQGILELGSEASSAAVVLVRACQDDDEEVRELVGGAIEDLGPPPLTAIASLRELCDHAHDDVAYWAVTLIGRLESSGVAALPELVACLRDGKPLNVRQRAAWALGKIGPAAAGALEPLREAASQGDPRLARLAREALDRISAGC